MGKSKIKNQTIFSKYADWNITSNISAPEIIGLRNIKDYNEPNTDGYLFMRQFRIKIKNSFEYIFAKILG